MPYNPDHIAGTVKRLADEAGSVRKFAIKAGLADKTVGNVIHRHHGMTIETAYKIAAAGGISIIELLGEAHRPHLDPEIRVLLAEIVDLVQRAEAAAGEPREPRAKRPPPRANSL